MAVSCDETNRLGGARLADSEPVAGGRWMRQRHGRWGSAQRRGVGDASTENRFDCRSDDLGGAGQRRRYAGAQLPLASRARATHASTARRGRGRSREDLRVCQRRAGSGRRPGRDRPNRRRLVAARPLACRARIRAAYRADRLRDRRRLGAAGAFDIALYDEMLDYVGEYRSADSEAVAGSQ